MKFNWELISLLFLFLIGISAQASQAKTITITTDSNIDMAYTQKIPLTFSNGQFILNKSIIITPFISVAGNKYNLTAYPSLSSNSQIQDRLYKHKWTLNISKPALVSSFDYVGFDVKGCKKYDDYILHCGGIEVDFSDIASSNYTVALTDTSVNITNPFMLSKSLISLDPTDTLLPNATHKAWKNATSTTTNCGNAYWLTNTEFTSTEYGKVNVSDDIRFSLGATAALFNTKCTMAKYTFNVSAVVADLGTITELKFVHEGQYSSEWDSYADLWWYNGTSGTWTNMGDIHFESDTVISETFTSTNILASGIATFGMKVYCVMKDVVSGLTDIAYLNVTYSGGEPPAGGQPPESDPLYCLSSPVVGSGISPVVLCMPRSNQTGQPLTGQTINCQAQLASAAYTGGTQASSAMTEQTNGLYNYTIQSGNLAPNTLYTVNCTTSIAGVNNNFGTVIYVMPDLYSAANGTNLQIASYSNFANNTATNNSLAVLMAASSSNFANVTSANTTCTTANTNIIAVGNNLTAHNQTVYELLVGLGINTSSTNDTVILVGINVSSLTATVIDLGNNQTANSSTLLDAVVSTNNTVKAGWGFTDRVQDIANGVWSDIISPLRSANSTIDYETLAAYVWNSTINDRTANCTNCTGGTAEIDYEALQNYTWNATDRTLTYYETGETNLNLSQSNIIMSNFDTTAIAIVFCVIALAFFFVYVGVNLQEQQQAFKIGFFIISFVCIYAALVITSELTSTGGQQVIGTEYNSGTSITNFTYGQVSNFTTARGITLSLLDPLKFVMFFFISYIILMVIIGIGNKFFR